MKILVLMPLDEKSVFMSSGIYRYMPKEIQEICLDMPMFMQGAIATKIAPHWLQARFDALVMAKAVYEAAEKNNLDLIILGNAPVDLKFDAVFNFQSITEDLPYYDDFSDKIKELVKNEPILMKWTDLHKKEESQFTLHDCKASALFLSEYLKTEPDLASVKKKYEGVLEFND